MSTARGRVAIVGGELLGLVLALRLRAQGCEVTVVAADGAAGEGSGDAGRHGWDPLAHTLRPSDGALLGLLGELGLGGRVAWRPARAALHTDGRLHPLSSIGDLLRFRPLAIGDRVRAALTVLRADRTSDPLALEQVRAADWLGQWSGRRALARVWLPLLRGRLGAAHHQAHAGMACALAARGPAGVRPREPLGYLVDGERALLTALRARLDAMGVELVDAGVPSEVRSEPGGAELHFADGDVRLFDRIALTGPCPSVAALCPQLTADEHARLARVAYQGVICVSLLVRHPLAGYYVTHVSDPTVPFDAMIEATALGGAERFDGHALVYLPRYLAPADPLWARSDGDIRRDFVAALERMHPKFRAAHVVATRVARVRALHAIPTLDYSRAALPSATTSLRNVFVVNAAQVAGGMARLNEAVAIANARAGLLASDLRASARLLAVVP